MKFKVTMKTPDTLLDAIRDAAKEDVNNLQGIDPDESQDLVDSRIEKAAKVAAKWFKYSEYLTVEVDTEAQTCVVGEYFHEGRDSGRN